MSNIEWTEKTWNPIVGCSKVSPGCHNCYAISMAHRLAAMSAAKVAKSQPPGKLEAYVGLTKEKRYLQLGLNPKPNSVEWTGKVRLVPETLADPLRRRKSTMYFVNSMADLFHESVPDEWIDQVMTVICLCPQHTFQVLTKRPERMREYFRRFDLRCVLHQMEPLGFEFMPDNVAWRLPFGNLWLGVSVENQACLDRIETLAQTPAAVRFVSAEPLLEDLVPEVEPHLQSIDWLIVGGESGAGARPFSVFWAERLVDVCAHFGVPVFVKQLGSDPRGWAGTKIDSIFAKKGDDMEEWPLRVRVREMPQRGEA